LRLVVAQDDGRPWRRDAAFRIFLCGIAAVGTCSALGAWNHFSLRLVLTRDPEAGHAPEILARRWLVAGLAGMGNR
jgi:ABC-type glycerol-3-phosphate transport system permease component